MAQEYRLQKYLARAGICSRRAAEELILSGRVSVNGKIVDVLGTKVIVDADKVALDGTEVVLPRKSTTLILHKPAGYVTSMARQRNEHIVAELVPIDMYPGLFPIGRLDVDTTGLLLFTNDGELGNALMHPRHHIPKTYQIYLKNFVTTQQISRLEKGVVLDDGPCMPAQIKRSQHNKKYLEMTIFEGRYHQVKRMIEAVGNKVTSLHRVRMGDLSLGNLPQGQWRIVSQDEIEEKLNVLSQ